jgi:hypothetical protein
LDRNRKYFDNQQSPFFLSRLSLSKFFWNFFQTNLSTSLKLWGSAFFF